MKIQQTILLFDLFLDNFYIIIKMEWLRGAIIFNN